MTKRNGQKSVKVIASRNAKRILQGRKLKKRKQRTSKTKNIKNRVEFLKISNK